VSGERRTRVSFFRENADDLKQRSGGKFRLYCALETQWSKRAFSVCLAFRRLLHSVIANAFNAPDSLVSPLESRPPGSS
jgi:hypothetical protein